jgi:hypothetical protein
MASEFLQQIQESANASWQYRHVGVDRVKKQW